MLSRRLLRTLLLLCCAPLLTQAAESVRVYLVRHAEVASPAMGVAAPGPSLSEAGKQRADALARQLAKSGIKTIYVSRFARTQQTAAPLASKLHLTPVVEEQDAPSLQNIAHAVRSMPAGSAVLVVGHSNTVPALIGLLGISPTPTIGESEFNKLFVVDVSGSTARIETRSYGKPSP